MILLDTNVVSELMRAAPDRAVQNWLSQLRDMPLVTSAITVAEISYGLARLPSGKRRDALEAQFAALVGADAALPVIGLDEIAAREAGRFRALREAAGLGASPSDMMIAGLAATLGAGVATRNVAAFSALPIQAIDPWA